MTDHKESQDLDNGDRPQMQRFSLLSHDILSALSEVLGGVRVLNASGITDEVRSQLNRITASGEALARLLDSVLSDDSQLRRDRKITARNINLARFLEDTDHRWTGLAKDKDVRFIIEKSANLPAIITVDRIALDRIVANLVSNAIKYTDKGIVTLKVHCTADKYLCFDVSDQGQGFSNAALARLFEYKGRPSGNTKPGSGLGLFIVKDLSAAIGGDVTAKNVTAGGATVSFRLPHKAWFNRSLLRTQLSEPGKNDAPPDLGHLKILLAEDNAVNQMVAVQMLASVNATCQVASDGVEAFKMLTDQHFDVVLLDIEMPRMSGLELIKKIRSLSGRRSQMTLIAITAYVMRDHRERICRAGADGIIAKPLMSIEDLGWDILEVHNRKTPELALVRDRLLDAIVDEPQATQDIVERKVFDGLINIIGPESSCELLGKLQADTDSIAQGINLGRRNLDLTELRAQTHILISVAGAVGATPLLVAAQRLNGAANRKNAAEIDLLCKACLSGLADLQAFIRVEQDKTAPPSIPFKQKS